MYDCPDNFAPGRLAIKFILVSLLAAGTFALLSPPSHAELHVLVDQVGYDTAAPKQALVQGTVQDHPQQFQLIEAATGKVVFTGSLLPEGKVDNWNTPDGNTYWLADFSGFKTPGQYELLANGAHSCAFQIADNLLERDTLSNIIYYFKGQRSSGLFDKADSHLPLPDGKGFVDVHGGWYDATGDYGIHFSQLNLTSYFNTQQVPLVAWTLLKSYGVLQARNDDNFSEYERRLLDEGLYGADFLVRMHRPNGSFFQDISAPGAHKLAKDRAIGDPNWHFALKTSPNQARGGEIEAAKGPYTYQVSFRSGGGMAIAALALASTMPSDGDFSRATYLKTAEEAFDFLNAHNLKLVNDGKENIIDDYCALMAATELYRASHQAKYLAAADARAQSLMARLTTKGKYHGYWRVNDSTRPFFSPSDAGLPVVSLLEYAQVASPAAKQRALQAVKESLQFELWTTGQVNNPFGYARQLVRMGSGQIRTAFFFPHDTEAAPWWQGENARLGSLAAAARMAAPLYTNDPTFQRQLEDYAWNQLHWILGRNPYDTSMLMGSGHNNVHYMFFQSWKYTSAPGAIVNGITAGMNSEDGIAFNQGFAVTGKDDDWRWAEQWLPHDAWYLYAVSLPHEP